MWPTSGLHRQLAIGAGAAKFGRGRAAIPHPAPDLAQVIGADASHAECPQFGCRTRHVLARLNLDHAGPDPDALGDCLADVGERTFMAPTPRR